jgi:hypothetical protein
VRGLFIGYLLFIAAGLTFCVTMGVLHR